MRSSISMAEMLAGALPSAIVRVVLWGIPAGAFYATVMHIRIGLAWFPAFAVSSAGFGFVAGLADTWLSRRDVEVVETDDVMAVSDLILFELALLEYHPRSCVSGVTALLPAIPIPGSLVTVHVTGKAVSVVGPRWCLNRIRKVLKRGS